MQESAVMHDGVTGTDKARDSIEYFSKACGADGTIVGLVDMKKYEAWLSGISVTFESSPAVPEGCKLK